MHNILLILKFTKNNYLWTSVFLFKMKIKLLLGLAFWILLFAVSCKSDDITFESPSKALRFSTDTVFCDTVYNQTRSETYAVKVYNEENKDVKIPKISLEGGSSSLYKINVDGQSGTEFTDVPLRKNDSLYIFVEIAPVANSTEAIAEDKIIFDYSVGTQEVTLFSVVQDAEYYIESESNSNIISSNTTWTKDKVKVVFGDLTIAEGKTLNIEPGTKVYFTKNSGLTVSENATLNASGTLDEEILFRGDRSDTKYDTLPLNWKGITAEAGSNIEFNYAKVMGGETGLYLKEATANISNTIIHTFYDFGILAVASTLNAKNLVMNNCGQSDIGIFKGGTADLKHCTLANYWELNSSLPAYSLYASNGWQNDEEENEYGNLSLKVYNSIIYGDKDTAVSLDQVSGYTFSYLFDSSLFKYNSNDAGFVFEGNSFVVNSYQNEDPLFLNYFTQKMNLRVSDASPAKGKGSIPAASLVPYDIKGILRTSSPTLGAYQ